MTIGCKVWGRSLIVVLHRTLCVTVVRSQKSAFVGGELLLDLAVTNTNAGYAAPTAITDIIWIHVSARSRMSKGFTFLSRAMRNARVEEAAGGRAPVQRLGNVPITHAYFQTRGCGGPGNE